MATITPVDPRIQQFFRDLYPGKTLQKIGNHHTIGESGCIIVQTGAHGDCHIHVPEGVSLAPEAIKAAISALEAALTGVYCTLWVHLPLPLNEQKISMLPTSFTDNAEQFPPIYNYSESKVEVWRDLRETEETIVVWVKQRSPSRQHKIMTYLRALPAAFLRGMARLACAFLQAPGHRAARSHQNPPRPR